MGAGGEVCVNRRMGRPWRYGRPARNVKKAGKLPARRVLLLLHLRVVGRRPYATRASPTGSVSWYLNGNKPTCDRVRGADSTPRVGSHRNSPTLRVRSHRRGQPPVSIAHKRRGATELRDDAVSCDRSGRGDSTPGLGRTERRPRGSAVPQHQHVVVPVRQPPAHTAPRRSKPPRTGRSPGSTAAGRNPDRA